MIMHFSRFNRMINQLNDIVRIVHHLKLGKRVILRNVTIHLIIKSIQILKYCMLQHHKYLLVMSKQY